MTKESARFLIKDAIISAGRCGERKPQNTPNTLKGATHRTASVERVHGKHGPHGKALHVERKTTEHTEHTEKRLHVGRDVGLSQPHTPRQD